MENSVSLERSASICKIPEKDVEILEDKQIDLVEEMRSGIVEDYRKMRFWPLFFTMLFGWMIVPIFIWRWYRVRLPKWHELCEIEGQLNELKAHRKQRKFWKKVRTHKNLLRSNHFQEINRFYHTLIRAIRQYNIRLDLFDYALDRQNKKLDPPFTVGELEQIELTFKRIFDELTSAARLLEVAEQNPEMDLANLLKDQYSNLHSSTDFVTQTVDLANSGQFIQELLVLESSLKEDIANLSHSFSPFQFTEDHEHNKTHST